MKKHTLLMALLMLISGIAVGQVRFGVKAGANMTSLFNESSTIDHTSPAFNFRLGGVMRYDFWFLTLQPELMFTAKSTVLNDAYDKLLLREYAHLTTANPALNVTQYSLELPINLQAGIKIKNTRIYGEFGPFVSLNLGGKFNGNASYYKNYNNDFAFHRLDYGIGVGAGAEYKNFLLSARWDWGLGRIGQEVADPLSLTEGNANLFNQMKYRNLNLSLTFVF